MKIEYTIEFNSGSEEFEKNLSGFLLEFHFLFAANVIPPYSVVFDLCLNDPAEWGGTNKIDWNKFSISIKEYDLAIKELMLIKGFSIKNIPQEIDTAHKWFLWQLELKNGVPYLKHKELAEEELKRSKLLDKAIKLGSEEDVVIKEMKYFTASRNLSVFFNSYF